MKLYTIPLIAILSFACAKEQPVAKPAAATVALTDTETAKRADIITFAKKYMGTPYCYAGSSPSKGFDCSGFVNFVFKNFDIDVPRSSSGFKNLGTSLKPEDFKVGDVLVFYGHRDRNSVGHVGIISEANGMKSKFIHASSGKEMAVTVSDLGSSQYTGRFYKCISVM
jgi:cell wall-associated NlpC family hydrolase